MVWLTRDLGMAFWRDYLRFKYKPGQMLAEGGLEKIADLPGGGNHFSPDGSKIYVSVGSATNVSVESDERHLILRDGSMLVSVDGGDKIWRIGTTRVR